MSLTPKIKSLTLVYDHTERVFHTVEDADTQVLVWAHDWMDTDLVEIDCEIKFINGVIARGDIVLQRDSVYHEHGFIRAVTAMATLAEQVRDFPKDVGEQMLKVHNFHPDRMAQMDNYGNN